MFHNSHQNPCLDKFSGSPGARPLSQGAGAEGRPWMHTPEAARDRYNKENRDLVHR